MCFSKSPAPAMMLERADERQKPANWANSELIHCRQEIAGLVESLGSLHEDAARMSFEALEAVQEHVLSEFECGVNSKQAAAALQCQIEAMIQMVRY